MLQKKERLNREEFNRFFSLGKRHHSLYFTLVYTKHPTLHASVVVSKKIEKRAVKRNKLRRRLYNIVRTYKDEKGVVGVYIIIVKAPAKDVSYQVLKEELTKIIGSIKNTG